MYRLRILILIGVMTGWSACAETNSEPLPLVQEVLQRVVVRAGQEQENDRAFATQYSFRKSKMMFYRNGQGELKVSRSKVSTNNPAAVVSNEVSARRTIEAEKEPVVFDTHGKVKPKDFDKKNLLANPRTLDRFDFTLVGREMFNDRATLVADFRPKQKPLPEPTLTDRFINKAAGRVWVDEAESVVVKADLHLTQRVDILNGVVGAVFKFTYRFTRERTVDGLWYVRDTHWHLEGREVVLNRIIDCYESKTDVRKVAAAVQH